MFLYTGNYFSLKMTNYYSKNLYKNIGVEQILVDQTGSNKPKIMDGKTKKKMKKKEASFVFLK